jgi:hypothetical protein
MSDNNEFSAGKFLEGERGSMTSPCVVPANAGTHAVLSRFGSLAAAFRNN